MRQMILGILIGVAMMGGVTVWAGADGPEIRGESGTLDYSVVIDGERVCSRPWVSIPDKVIECDRVK